MRSNCLEPHSTIDRSLAGCTEREEGWGEDREALRLKDITAGFRKVSLYLNPHTKRLHKIFEYLMHIDNVISLQTGLINSIHLQI